MMPYCEQTGEPRRRKATIRRAHQGKQLCGPQEAVAALVAVQHRVENAG
jgi:hypothetical protein